jgi:oxygen-independent coproporphyrinogen-3 oxidase
LLREIDMRDELDGFDTLYLGGGTPSLLDLDDLHAIRERAPLATACRVFLEANPEDVSESALAGWRALGVSTLSLGVQAFDDEALAFLGRRHSAAEADAAVATASGAGFETLSLDLIFGLPGQTLDAWRTTLDRALAHEPDHISCYQLTIHESTLFGRAKREGRLDEAPDDIQAELFRETHRVLADAGYDGYEVSNFARGGEHRSEHNEKYWDHTPYLGVGPSAHSFDGSTRSWNARNLFRWQAAVDDGIRPLEGEETLDDPALLLETIMLRCRTRDGLDLDAVRERFGVDLRVCNRELFERWCEDGLVELSGHRLCPTIDGLAVADSLAASIHIPSDSWQQTLR